MADADKPPFTARLLVLATREQTIPLTAEGPILTGWLARHAGGLHVLAPAPPPTLFAYGSAAQFFVAELSSSDPAEILLARQNGTAKWRCARDHEVQTLAFGQAPWGTVMPAPWPSLAFVWHYLAHPTDPRIPPITKALWRAYRVAHDGEHWARDFQILGFSDGQIRRITGDEPDCAPKRVPFGAELGFGPLQDLLRHDATCKGCKVGVGQAHKPDCIAKECVQCARPAGSAGACCQTCLKLGRRLPPHVQDDDTKYSLEPPTALSPRCLAWWSRIMGGWLPNRRIITMGYESSTAWYGVRVWEYRHILAPAIAHLTGDRAGCSFEGALFGLKLPFPPAPKEI